MAVSNLPGLGNIKPGSATQNIKNWANIVQTGKPISANTFPAATGKTAPTVSTPATRKDDVNPSLGPTVSTSGSGKGTVSTAPSTAGNANSAANSALSTGSVKVSSGGKGNLISVLGGLKGGYSEENGLGSGTGLGTGTGAGSSSGNAGSATGTTAEDAIKSNIKELHDNYQEQLRKNLDYNTGKIQGERDVQLRDQFLSHKKTMAQLPEQLAAMGVTGGGVQSNLTRMNSDYQGARNDAFTGSREQTADLGRQFQQDAAEGTRTYGESLLRYLMDLEMLEKEHQNQLNRDRLNAQYDYQIAMAGA